MPISWAYIRAKIRLVNLEKIPANFTLDEKKVMVEYAEELSRVKRYPWFMGRTSLEMMPRFDGMGFAWKDESKNIWFAEGAVVMYRMVVHLVENFQEDRASEVMAMVGMYLMKRRFRIEGEWARNPVQLSESQPEVRMLRIRIVEELIKIAKVNQGRGNIVRVSFGLPPQPELVFATLRKHKDRTRLVVSGIDKGAVENNLREASATDTEGSTIDSGTEERVEEGSLCNLRTDGAKVSREAYGEARDQVASRPFTISEHLYIRNIRVSNFLLIVKLDMFETPLVWCRTACDGYVEVIMSKSGPYESVSRSFRKELSAKFRLEEAALEYLEEQMILASPLRVYGDLGGEGHQVCVVWWEDSGELLDGLDDNGEVQHGYGWYALEKWCRSTYKTPCYISACVAWREVLRQRRERASGVLAGLSPATGNEAKTAAGWIMTWVWVTVSGMIGMMIGVWIIVHGKQ